MYLIDIYHFNFPIFYFHEFYFHMYTDKPQTSQRCQLVQQHWIIIGWFYFILFYASYKGVYCIPLSLRYHLHVEHV